jgi:hypothetical protein
VTEISPFERDLRQLETDLRKLEAEYTMYFAGTLPRPPLETRARVESLIRRYDRAYIQSYADRFRFDSLRSRYVKFTELWDRALRSREEGRGSGLGAARGAAPPRAAAAQPPHPEEKPAGEFVTTIMDARRDAARVKELHERLVEAGRSVGQGAPSFRKFVHLVTAQVEKLRKSGTEQIAFRVGVKDGKVVFTAKAVKTPGGSKPGE